MHEDNDIFLLSIDGGGIFGIIPLVMLHHLEHRSGRPISQLFHVIAGTSTGGLIALGLACPGVDGRPQYSAHKLLEIYIQYAQRIFQKSPWSRWGKIIPGLSLLRSTFHNHYSARHIGSVFSHLFHTTTLSQALLPVLVPAYAIGGSASGAVHLKVFRSRPGGERPPPSQDFFFTDVALATSAVPMYFPPHWASRAHRRDLYPPEYCFIDGGVAVNDPALLSYVETSLLFPQKAIHILSLSGGQETCLYHIARPRTAGGGIWAWRKDIAKLIIGPAVVTQQQLLRGLLEMCGSTSSVVRLQGGRTSPQLSWDDATPENLQFLEKEGRALLQGPQGAQLDAFLDKILRSRGTNPPAP